MRRILLGLLVGIWAWGCDRDESNSADVGQPISPVVKTEGSDLEGTATVDEESDIIAIIDAPDQRIPECNDERAGKKIFIGPENRTKTCQNGAWKYD